MSSPKQCRVALTLPEFKGFRSGGENLGIAYIEAALRESTLAEVQLVNRTGDLENAAIAQSIRAFSPDIVGIGLPSNHLLPSFRQLAQEIRQNTPCTIVGGGHYTSFRPREILQSSPHVDVLVVGEGEQAIVDLVKCHADSTPLSSVVGVTLRDPSTGACIQTPPRPKIQNLDDLPLPTRDPGLDVYNISASRGCYTTCSFCSVPQFNRLQPGKSFRLRSPDSISKEVAMLKGLGAKAISFVDDVFLLPGDKGLERARAIADIMASNNMKWAFGCRTPDLTEEIVAYCRPRGLCNIGIGIESAVPEILARFSKRAGLEHSRRAIDICRKYDVSIMPYFIMFEPDMTIADVTQNITFMSGYGLLWPSFASNSLDPYPGTSSFDWLEREGRITERDSSFVPKFMDPKVEELIAHVLQPLSEAQECEFALRKKEFQADLLDGTEGTRRRESVRRALGKLSSVTATFLLNAIGGNYNAETVLLEPASALLAEVGGP